jgi:phenylalanyl-tRNA synthetase beta chain
MLVPVSWLKDYVDIDIPAELLAERLTLAGLEVNGIHYIGVPQQQVPGVRLPPSDHLVWDREKILLGAIREVKAHPNADRLVLALVDYGGDALEQCVTGAPNLFDYKDQGPIDPPLWTPFAKEGAEVWDGHSDTPKRMILKEKPLRGIPNRSMVCSEKELGISEEHEGILLLEHNPDYVPGTPFQDILGDVIFDIDLTPNLARCFSIVGVAREVAALLGKEIRYPSYEVLMQGASIIGQAFVRIEDPEYNPRFTLALLRDTKVQPSPGWMQRRLKLVGQRPINNIVDVTNYITFELGQPLHAFDYDKLVARAGGKAPTITTRLARPGETLETLDEVKRELEPHNIILLDDAGILSMGGIIGGAETEISDTTTNVLLEAANWNFINIRRTMQSQKVITDAGVRFSRGVHPSQALLGLRRGIELMRQTGGGQIAQDIIDEYPLKPEPVSVDLPVAEVRRILGMDFSAETAAQILTRLEFDVTISGEMLHVVAPDHRLDISSEPVTGQADLIEEIARIHGYDQIPNTIIEDEMPEQRANPIVEREERARDVLAALGLQENISYRLTTPEREAQLTPDGQDGYHSLPYVRVINPTAPDKTVMRHTLLAALLETAVQNARHHDSQQVFEIGSVYLPRAGQRLPDEPRRLAIIMTGRRYPAAWTPDVTDSLMDYFDLKGVVDALLDALKVPGVTFTRASHATFHPGRSAELRVDGQPVGVFGELHPLVARSFGLTAAPVLAAEFDLDALLAQARYARFSLKPLPVTPPVYQDIALVVKDQTTAAEVEAVIWKAGGDLLKGVRLFDVYAGDPIPAGHKSLAYSLTYQTDDKTLTDKEVAKVHQKIVRAAESQLGAQLRA